MIDDRGFYITEAKSKFYVEYSYPCNNIGILCVYAFAKQTRSYTFTATLSVSHIDLGHAVLSPFPPRRCEKKKSVIKREKFQPE